MNRDDDKPCKISCFNEELVKTIKDSLIGNEELENLAELYKLLGNPTRLKIIFALTEGELCVCDIAHVLALSTPATSQQLKLLRQGGLLKYRNDGRMSYYSLKTPNLLDAIRRDAAIIDAGKIYKAPF